jgi:hypothetical protein
MSTRPSISMFSSSEAVAIEQHSTTPSVSRNAPGTARIEGRLTSPIARVPESTASAGGITVKGHTIRTFAYTTDAAVIRNTNADAILAVYPFTGEPVITKALLTVAQQPLFVGVGGRNHHGDTRGRIGHGGRDARSRRCRHQRPCARRDHRGRNEFRRYPRCGDRHGG